MANQARSMLLRLGFGARRSGGAGGLSISVVLKHCAGSVRVHIENKDDEDVEYKGHFCSGCSILYSSSWCCAWVWVGSWVWGCLVVGSWILDPGPGSVSAAKTTIERV